MVSCFRHDFSASVPLLSNLKIPLLLESCNDPYKKRIWPKRQTVYREWGDLAMSEKLISFRERKHFHHGPAINAQCAAFLLIHIKTAVPHFCFLSSQFPIVAFDFHMYLGFFSLILCSGGHIMQRFVWIWPKHLLVGTKWEYGLDFFHRQAHV